MKNMLSAVMMATAVVFLVSVGGCSGAGDPASLAGLPGEYQNRPLVGIPQLPAPEKLTGDLSDPVWQQAAALPMNNPATGEPPKHETTARVFCTDDALYIGFRCAEPSDGPLDTKGEFWDRDEVEIGRAHV